MKNISCAAELKLAILEKQFELDVQGQLLKEQFLTIYESLKPISILKSTLTELSSSPNLIENMLSVIMGVISGYLSKKIAVGGSHNLFRKILGSVLQFGISNIVAQHPKPLKTFGLFILKHLFHKNKKR